LIDPATRWFEMVRIWKKDSETIALLVDRIWFAQYPRPRRCIHDNRNGFTGFGFQELLESYGVEDRVTTVKKPQANAILEHVHQVLGNMLRTYGMGEYSKETLKGDEFMDGVVANVSFAVHATYHTALMASPGQVIFGRDMMFPTRYVVNWNLIHDKKTKKMQEDNRRENAS
jgi:transposase InsO family protein